MDQRCGVEARKFGVEFLWRQTIGEFRPLLFPRALREVFALIVRLDPAEGLVVADLEEPVRRIRPPWRARDDRASTEIY
jgi:hypothetical protein